MTQPQRPVQPVDPQDRADDEPSVAIAQQATPPVHDWLSQPNPQTYLAPVPSALLAVQVGTLVAVRYKVVNPLFEGGMGLVFRAWDKDLGRDVVLKFIRPELADQPGMVERLMEEATAVARLNHPHVVTLHNREADQHGKFLVMEFVDGPNLLQLLKQSGGKLSVEQAVRYIGQVGAALQAAHDAGILHRDVKPSNVLVNQADIAKLADFGLARINDGRGLTQAGDGPGTPVYMAPEQHHHPPTVSQQSDQYSLAATLYQLVTGRSPLRIREQAIPESMRDVLLRALEEEPQERFPSVADFIQALPGVMKEMNSGAATVRERTQASSEHRFLTGAAPGQSPSRDTVSPVEPDLAELLAQTHARIEKVLSLAKLAYAQHNYSQTTTLLESLPEQVRDAALHRDAVTKRDRVNELDRLIREATPVMNLDVLRPAVGELLQLQPDRQDMQRLKEQVARLTPAPTVRVPLPPVKPMLPPVKPMHSSPVCQPGSKAGERTAFTLNGIEYAFRWCPPGKFTMGSPKSEAGRSDDEDQVSVELTSGFWMQETTVTQAMWQAVMGTRPWQGQCFTRDGANYPATYVDWPSTSVFSTKLTAAARKAGVLSDTAKMVIPTEACWEYGCRAGTTTAHSFGNDASKFGEFAWLNANAHAEGESYAHEVGQKKPNPWGLLDMHGNVWEWCQDAYEEKLPGGPAPLFAVEPSRGLRGGCWGDTTFDARSSRHLKREPAIRGNSGSSVGFRLVVEL
ncbi:MAG: bifunctional serine/threonine-protein kinase/formylglycine-generating enzyme family protein [Planctomycetaceae bacterium]